MIHWLMAICLISAVSKLQMTSASVVSSTVTASETTIERVTKVSSDSLKNDNDFKPGDVILSYIETIPVVGYIIRLIKRQDEDETKDMTNKILAQLKTLYQLQRETLVSLQNLDNKINLVVLKNRIATSSKIINNSITDLSSFLKNPSSLAHTERFLKYFDCVMAEVRQILEGKEFSLMSPKLCSYIIQQVEYFNGTHIIKTNKYLFEYTSLDARELVWQRQLYMVTRDDFFPPNV